MLHLLEICQALTLPACWPRELRCRGAAEAEAELRLAAEGDGH